MLIPSSTRGHKTMPFDEPDVPRRPPNPNPSVVNRNLVGSNMPPWAGVSNENGVKVTNTTQLQIPWDGKSNPQRWPTPEESEANAGVKAFLEFLELCEQKAADPSVTFINELVNESWEHYV
jgi:hypothetical protein